MNRIAAVSLLVLAPSLAGADSVFLKSGGEIKGEVVEQRADAVVMEVGPGRVTVPMKNVARIVSSTTDLGVYHARAAALARGDVAGWLSLAAWAQRRNLATQAREAYEHVLDVDPMNADANLALGHVRMADGWLSGAEANRARGLVEFEGMWMTPQERQMRFEERAAADQERMAAREGEARAGGGSPSPRSLRASGRGGGGCADGHGTGERRNSVPVGLWNRVRPDRTGRLQPLPERPAPTAIGNGPGSRPGSRPSSAAHADATRRSTRASPHAFPPAHTERGLAGFLAATVLTFA